MFNQMQKGSSLAIAIFIITSVIVSGCVPQNNIDSSAGEDLQSVVLLKDPTPL